MAGAAGAAGALAARALLMPAVDPLYGGGSPRHGSFRRFCPYHSRSAARISSVGPSRWYSSLLCSKKARNAGYSAPDELIRGGGRTNAAVVRAKRSSGRVVAAVCSREACLWLCERAVLATSKGGHLRHASGPSPVFGVFKLQNRCSA